MIISKSDLRLSNLLHEHREFSPSKFIRENAHIQTPSEYEKLYDRSINDSERFWLEQSNKLDWIKSPTIACKYRWDTAANFVEHTWFEDGILNVSFNCLDRHVHAGRGDKKALIWQGDDPSEHTFLTYSELLISVCKCANALKALGVRKGDRVCIYMPMIPELAIAMLACARIGAIHSIVFGGFSAESLIHRINDSGCRLVICANEGHRGGKIIPLKSIVDEALLHTPTIEKVLVVKRTEAACDMNETRDLWFHQFVNQQLPECIPEPMQAEDPLFILYTSGSTGKPKGVVHTQAGYLLHASLSHYYYFDLHDTDIYWCTADIGWVTGHSYVIYGPLANCATTLLFEGTPLCPTPARFWEIIEKFKVTIFYTAPTAIRTLIAHGENLPSQSDLSSLRILGTVGEPINPEVWIWYHDHVGNGKCPIVDTWWQTETGGVMISAMPGAHTLKPGSAGRPFLGVDPIILSSAGDTCPSNEGGNLCIKRPWPGMMRTTWGDHQRFIDTYFKAHHDVYFSGDGCRIDDDGDYWLLGRIDDVINISGHRIGSSEVESALVSHPSVAEAAIVPIPDDIKGQALYAFITLKENADNSSSLKEELKLHVKKEIGGIAIPSIIQIARGLPKTRSGKIMRRILRKIAENNYENLGDISTLADPTIVSELIADRKIL